MTAGAHVRHEAAQQAGFLARLWRWIRNTFYQLVFGQSELQRLCSSAYHDERQRMVPFRTAVALSSALIPVCNVLFDFEPFDVDQMHRSIVKHGQMQESNVMAMRNLRNCLFRCNFVNMVYQRLYKLQRESYDSNNAEHEAKLEQLWSALKPNTKRSGGRITKEWGEIGFQGTDPMTDFRGMGVLSLVQLLYFASSFPDEAQRALAASNHTVRWYPFAVAGINITGFLMELVQERLIDVGLYEVADVAFPKNEERLEKGITAVHEMYTQLFIRFNKLWVDSKPRDAMMFPVIFQVLKDAVRTELKAASFQA